MPLVAPYPLPSAVGVLKNDRLGFMWRPAAIEAFNRKEITWPPRLIRPTANELSRLHDKGADEILYRDEAPVPAASLMDMTDAEKEAEAKAKAKAEAEKVKAQAKAKASRAGN